MRLVDADALIEVIEKSRPLNWTDSESELQENADYNHFIEMVKEQPIAYSIEKVVAELEEKINGENCFYDNNTEWNTVPQRHVHKYAEYCYTNAIDIVRKGGAE